MCVLCMNACVFQLCVNACDSISYILWSFMSFIHALILVWASFLIHHNVEIWKKVFWVKLVENLRVARVWCRNMKNVVLGWFWLTLTFSQPRVDYGHFGHLTWNGTLSASMPKQVAPHQSRRFCGLMEKS